MNEIANEQVSNIDLFPTAALPVHRSSSARISCLDFRHKKREGRHFAKKGRAEAEVKGKGFGGRKTWAQIQAQPMQHPSPLRLWFLHL